MHGEQASAHSDSIVVAQVIVHLECVGSDTLQVLSLEHNELTVQRLRICSHSKVSVVNGSQLLVTIDLLYASRVFSTVHLSCNPQNFVQIEVLPHLIVTNKIVHVCEWIIDEHYPCF